MKRLNIVAFIREMPFKLETTRQSGGSAPTAACEATGETSTLIFEVQ